MPSLRQMGGATFINIEVWWDCGDDDCDVDVVDDDDDDCETDIDVDDTDDDDDDDDDDYKGRHHGPFFLFFYKAYKRPLPPPPLRFIKLDVNFFEHFFGFFFIEYDSLIFKTDFTSL